MFIVGEIMILRPTCKSWICSSQSPLPIDWRPPQKNQPACDIIIHTIINLLDAVVII